MAALPPAPPPPPSRSIRTQEDNPNAVTTEVHVFPPVGCTTRQAAASTGAISATMPFKHELQCSTATVCEYVLDLFNKKKYADIVLIPNSTDQGGEFDTCERIYANRAILASWSPVFEHMLFPCVQAMENGANTLEGLPVIHLHCGYSTMHQAISYVYGHKVDLGLKDLWPLHCFLSTYQLKNEFGETVQRILEEAISVETCCELLNCVVELDGGGTGGDHYPLRKARRLILMEFNEVAKTEGYASLHWEILKDILASDDLTCAEEQVFHNAMRWVEADEARVAAHLEDILRLIRLPLMDSKVVAALDSHPVASRSQDLPKLQLAALKYHLNPAGAAAVGCRLRRGAIYWRATKSNSCINRSERKIETFVLAVPADLMVNRSWRLIIDKFSEDSIAIVGVLAMHDDLNREDSVEPGSRYSNGWGLACSGNLYNGGCKCSPTMQDLCTPICHTHLPFLHCSTGVETIDLQITGEFDLIATIGLKSFTRRLALPSNGRLFPAVSLLNAKARIVSSDDNDSET